MGLFNGIGFPAIVGTVIIIGLLIYSFVVTGSKKSGGDKGSYTNSNNTTPPTSGGDNV